MKKRLLVTAMSIMLMLAMPAMAASIESGSGFKVDEDRSIRSVAVTQTQVYILDQDGNITTRTAASWEETLVGKVNQYGDPYIPEEKEKEVIITELIELDGKVYGINVDDGTFFELVNERGKFAPVRQDLVLDMSAFTYPRGEYTSILEIGSLFTQDGWLYYTGKKYVDTQEYLAGRISLETGEHTAISIPALRELAPYKDGKLLALLYAENAIDNGIVLDDRENLAEIAVLDPQSNSLHDSIMLQTDGLMGGYYTSNICYAEDQVYYLDSARVIGLDLKSGKNRISAYTGDSASILTNLRNYYVDGYYLTYDYSGLILRKLDDENLKDGVLTVYSVQGYGDYDGEVHKTFAQNYPEIPVDRINSEATDYDSLVQALMSENQMLDVLQLQLAFQPVDKLAQKGYCLDLSEYPEITSRIETMYPKLRDAMLMDGKLYGVPVDISASCLGVNMPRWEELGLSKDDLPTSFLELLDFIANWSQDYGDEFSDIELFSPQKPDYLFSSLVGMYSDYRQHEGKPLLFDTPEFRQLVHAFEQIDFSEFSKGAETTRTFNYNLDNRLFILHESVVDFYQYESGEFYTPLPLSLLGDDEPLIRTNLTIMIINPRTKRLDQALKYMANFLDNLEPRSNYTTMYTDHNDPVDTLTYKNDHEFLSKRLAEAEERMAAASEEYKSWINVEVETYQNDLAILEENRYDVTAEEIAAYRESVAPFLFVVRDYKLHLYRNASSADFNQIQSKYTENIITLDQLIKELDSRLKIMEMED